MVPSENSSRPSAPMKVPGQRSLRPQSLPSPALCCACGLCILLAGINITLVGAFAFSTFLPIGNPPIIIGPLLLLVALAFFTACCVVSRRPSAPMDRRPNGGEKWGLMRMGTAVFEMETSDNMLQDTTAVQLSPTNSLTSSHKSGSSHRGDASPPPNMAEMSDVGVNGDNTTLTSDSKASTPTQMLPAQNTSST
ncbi:transmembrane protein 275-like [Anoplopoma fimbria]|uniref:transmembrane protein 275-like n=1 Tax=Anoplopoma fimbria TaxID=229290 RepID=UPI0023EE052B|nr:transmembrane protein 275-like [Anoplopoma fimbria]